MKTVFCRFLPDVPVVPLLYPNVGKPKEGGALFMEHAFDHLVHPLIRVVDTPEAADVLLLPHPYNAVCDNHTYMEEMLSLAREQKKLLLIFAYGDDATPVALPWTRCFRTSLYRYKQRLTEVAMPAYAEDLLTGKTFTPRKKSFRPVVGFCGWAEYRSLKNRLGTLAQNAVVRLRSIVEGRHVLAERKGLSFRRAALQALRSSLIDERFILRSSYSAHKKTISLDPAHARADYLRNLEESDLVLCVKGDGNYSLRFYEALSMGRIPLLIDTQCVLPLEDTIDYSECILRVPFTDIHNLAQIVSDWYSLISESEFIRMQTRAREIFETRLRSDQFLKEILSDV